MATSGSTVTPASSHWRWESCRFNKKTQQSYVWNKDQEYEGNFFRGSLHGEGAYKWRNLATYEGAFYSNHKEGYALMSFPDNSSFEGLFVSNERFGPGIFTHSNGRQDVGFWKGEKLVRLSRAVNCIVPRLAPTSAAKIKLLQFRRLISVDEEEFRDPLDGMYFMCECPETSLACPYSSLIFDPRSYFFDRITFNRTYFLNCKDSNDNLSGTDTSDLVNLEECEVEEQEEKEGLEIVQVPSHCLCNEEEFVMNYLPASLTDVCGNEENTADVQMGILSYFTNFGTVKGIENKSSRSESPEEVGEPEGVCKKLKGLKILSWNRSELCIEMLQQIFRFRALEGKLTFNIAKLITGARMAFRKTGKREMECLEFLKACAFGPPNVVKAMLCNYEVSEELTDARGNNSVMFAAAADQQEIIDILADYGADTNSFNDESLTPLNLCLLRRLAHTYNLGNWETAFLPKEIEVADKERETDEWRQQISISSLDRIFGDGTSYKASEPAPGNPVEGMKDKSTKSIITTDSRSIMYMPEFKKSFLPVDIYSQKSIFASSYETQKRTKSSSSSLPRQPCAGLLQEGPPFHPILKGTKTTSKMETKIRVIDEFQKSQRPSSKEFYLFDLTPEKQEAEDTKKEGTAVRFRRMDREEEREEEPGEGDFSFNAKTAEIDRTIEILLKRGADPNSAEVPKPSIHLGVYTKSWKIVNSLLSYGANPNNRLYSNEGLLTPLHVLVLLKPSREFVEICELLLCFGADPEEETLPEFAFYEEEKPFLCTTKGRTPLQLLCMRPDLEYVDPEGYLIKVALTLANASDKTRLYNGYTYPALAMWFGNVKLLKAFLDCKLFNPNALLGCDLGTILHVLVSTAFQKKTKFETSIQICDILLNAKANPLKHISEPKKLEGNCIDYGYREVEEEKASRHALEPESKEGDRRSKDRKSSKKTVKIEKPESIERDHLLDQINVLEYLSGRTREMKRNRKRYKNDQTDTGEKIKLGKPVKGENGEEKKGVKTNQVGQDLNATTTENENRKKQEESENKRKQGESENKRKQEESENRKKQEESENRRKQEESENRKNQTKERNAGIKVDKNVRKMGENKSENVLKMEERTTGNELTEEKINVDKKFMREENKSGKARDQLESSQERNEPEKGKRKNNKNGKKHKSGGKKANEATSKKVKKKKKKTGKKKEEIMRKLPNVKVKSKPCLSETFPEKLRQSILNYMGNCPDFDVNELLLPYVVLRDGNLYYDTQKKSSRGKEQYSLI